MRQQQGVALITAILVVAIAAIAAAAVVSSANIAIRRAGTLQDSERAWWYADGLEAWAKVILQRDDNKGVDHLGEDWAQVVDYLPVDQGHLGGRIVDLQGRFNLNNLRDQQGGTPQTDQFKRLMSCIEGVDTFAAPELANAILDWTDSDDTGMAEDLTYLSLLPVAYRTANQPMHSVSELLALQGMTRELYNALRPYVSALPKTTKINVNTAPGPVLCSLLENPADAANVDSFIDEREDSPVSNTNELTNKLGPSVKLDLTQVTTSYFQIEGRAFIGSSRVGLYSVVGRGANGVPVVLRRSIDAE